MDHDQERGTVQERDLLPVWLFILGQQRKDTHIARKAHDL
jgi:hypothetical protein